MKTLYEPAAVQEVKDRIASVTPASQRQWGTMTAGQAMAHCAIGMEVAVGDRAEPQMFLGRLIGRFVKPLVLGRGELRRNAPTAPFLIVADDPDLEPQKQRLVSLIDRFVNAGPAGCTTNPHAFFGRMTPHEWSLLGYKHLDHHLRQFSA